MFRTLTCPSSGGNIVFTQHLISSLSVNVCTVDRLRAYCSVEAYTDFWWGNLRERENWRDPDVDGKIILSWIFRKWDVVVGTGWSWLKIGTGGGHLWVR